MDFVTTDEVPLLLTIKVSCRDASFAKQCILTVIEQSSRHAHFSVSFKLVKFSDLDTRQPGSVFKILHTRQSEIILEFPRKKFIQSFFKL